MKLITLIEVLEDESFELCEFYLYNFETDDLEEFISYLNKSGNTAYDIIEMFKDYQMFEYMYCGFLELRNDF